MNVADRVCLGIWSLAICATLTGCGSGNVPLIPVSGVVTLDGEPLVDAEVIFEHHAGRPSVGRTDNAGRYTLTYVGTQRGALPGEHKVRISTFLEPDSDSSDPVKMEGRKETVPARYNQQTELSVEVGASRKEPYDFELKSDSK